MAGYPCCCPAGTPLFACGSFPGQPYYQWLQDNGWDGTQGNASLTIAGSSCGLAGNSGTFSLAVFGPTNDDYQLSSGGAFGCTANPNLSVIIGCDGANSRLVITGYYDGFTPTDNYYLPFPVSPASLFGATIVLPLPVGWAYGTWTVTLPG